jgi:tRNA modification GTPase
MATIFAQSSAYGKSGIAVYRISGNKALDTLKILTKKDYFKPRKAHYAKIFHPLSNKIIDYGLVIYFPKQNSFTGEEVVELHLHGSIAVSKIIMDALGSFEFLRLADPGEFSKRAFLNGKIDLTSAEGIADLINAETIMQHDQAIAQMSGHLAAIYEGWRMGLLKIMALIEAFIDFPDEEIPLNILGEITIELDRLKSELRNHLNDNRRGEKLRSGINLAIFGPPNVGKSSLMNYLVGRDVAIVSPIAGTTRDAIEAFIDFEGYPISIVDTAGIRGAVEDAIEQEGIKRAINNTKQADIKILLLSIHCDINKLDSGINSLLDDKTIIIINKADLIDSIPSDNLTYISLKNALNLQALRQKIQLAAIDAAGLSQSPGITRARYRQNIESALRYLENFSLSKDLVLSAEDIRQAMRHLSFITGKISIDEILGEIFSSFCIGK